MDVKITIKIFIKYENESSEHFENRVNKYLAENELTNKEDRIDVSCNEKSNRVIVFIKKTITKTNETRVPKKLGF